MEARICHLHKSHCLMPHRHRSPQLPQYSPGDLPPADTAESLPRQHRNMKSRSGGGGKHAWQHTLWRYSVLAGSALESGTMHQMPSAAQEQTQRHSVMPCSYVTCNAAAQVDAFELTEATPPPPTPAGRHDRHVHASPPSALQGSQQQTEEGHARHRVATDSEGANQPSCSIPGTQAAHAGSPDREQPQTPDSGRRPAESTGQAQAASRSPPAGLPESPSSALSLQPMPAAAGRHASPDTATDGPSEQLTADTPAQQSLAAASGTETPSPRIAAASSASSPGSPTQHSGLSPHQQHHSPQQPVAGCPAQEPDAGLTAAKPMALGMSRRASLRRVTLAPGLPMPR